VAKDPIRFGAETTNLFEYSSGDPVNRSDVTGLLSLGDTVDTVGAAMDIVSSLEVAGAMEDGAWAVAKAAGEFAIDYGVQEGLQYGAGLVAAGFGTGVGIAGIVIGAMDLYGWHLDVQISRAEFELRMLRLEQELLRAAHARDLYCRARGYNTNFLRRMVSQLPILRRHLARRAGL
jgi:hypothetical protein